MARDEMRDEEDRRGWRLAVRHRSPRAAQWRAGYRDLFQVAGAKVLPDGLTRSEGGAESRDRAGDDRAAGPERQPRRAGLEAGQQRLAVGPGGGSGLALQPAGR